MKEKMYVIGKRFLLGIAMLLVVMLLPKTVVYAGTNNSQETAEVIAVNTSYSGLMDSEYSWYKVKLTKSGYFYLDFDRLSEDGYTASSLGWDISLYVNGKFILENKYVSAADSHYISPNYGYPKDTVVYLRIKDSWAGTKVPYKFSICNKSSNYWESEKNDSQKTADKMTLNKYYYGNFPVSDTVDYYYTKLAKTGYAQIYFGRRDLDGDTYINTGWKLSVIVDGKIVLDRVSISENAAVNGYISPKFGYKKGQKIYVRVEENGAGTAVDYKIKIKNTSSSVWETENNNSKSKADTIKLNKKFYGVCMKSNDTDWYKYKITKDGTLKFYGGKNSLDDNGWYDFKVYVNSKQVISANNNNDVIKKMGSFKVKKGQTVYVKVTSNYNSTYAIKLKY